MTATVTATAGEAPAAPQAGPASPTRQHAHRLVVPMPDDRLQGWLATVGVALIAGVWRFWHLSRPRGIIFDETYYTVDARDLLQNGVEHNRGYLFTVHPPLGNG